MYTIMYELGRLYNQTHILLKVKYIVKPSSRGSASWDNTTISIQPTVPGLSPRGSQFHGFHGFATARSAEFWLGPETRS